MSRTNNFVSRNLGYAFIIVGFIFLGISIDYSNSIAALFAATLILWGGLLFYVKTSKCIKYEIVEKVFRDFTLLYENTTNISFTEKPVYFTEGSLEEIRSVRVKISAKEGNNFLITPPGDGLHRLIETEMGVNFSSVDLKDISKRLEDIIVYDLDLASSISIAPSLEKKHISLTIEDNIFHSEDIQDGGVFVHIGDPLSSAIACIITRSTGNRIIIDSVKSERNKMDITFQILTRG